MEAVEEKMSSLTLAKRPDPMKMKLAIAKPVSLISNYFSINLRTNKRIVVYDVKFFPEIPSDNIRKKKHLIQKLRLEKQLNLLEPIICNGDNLFSPKECEDNIIMQIKYEQTEYYITLIKSSFIGVDEIVHPKTNKALTAKYFLNVIIKQMLNSANFLPLGSTRKYFNSKKLQNVPDHHISVTRGYSTCINLLEGGLLLKSDFATRVINQTTVRKFIQDFKNNASTEKFEKLLTEALVGKSVLGGYGSFRLYRINDIDFESTPNSEKIIYTDINTKMKEEITLTEYYKKVYNIDIKYPNEQLLLINKTFYKDKKSKERIEITEMRKKLVPELCYLTGLDDSMRSDYDLMKNLAQYTKLNSGIRMNEIKRLITLFREEDLKPEKENGETPFLLAQKWGLEFNSDPVHIKGNVLNPQQIQLGKDKKETASLNGLLNFKTPILNPMYLDNWILCYTKRDEENAEIFFDTLKKSSETFGIAIKPPELARSAGQYSDQLIEAAMHKINQNKLTPDFVVFILPFAYEYAKIKKEFLSSLPETINKAILTQVILSKTLKRKGLMSICSNIALQMSAKINYPLWKVVTNKDLPFRKMVVGMDLSRFSNEENVLGMSASIDPYLVKFYTQVRKVKKIIENISQPFSSLISSALDKFLEATQQKHFYPELIIIYRDGVSDSQIEDLLHIEVPAILKAIKSIKDYNPRIIFATVNKTSGVRFFESEENGNSKHRGRGGGNGKFGLENPSSGTYVDSTIVQEGEYEFYLMPQFVSEGSASPVKFKVLYDNSGIPLEIFVEFTNAMCYNYFNWKGAIKTPGPCKYAKKAAEMYTKYTQSYPKEDFQKRLYFL